MSSSLHVFIDYAFVPYALGDTFTLLVNMEIQRLLKGKDDIVQLVLADPASPKSQWQPFVNSSNFRSFLIELFPAYLFSPSTSRLTFTESRPYFYHQLVKSAFGGRSIWPGIYAQARGAFDFFSHKAINRFFFKHGSLPLLEAPEALRHRARHHLETRFAGKRVVTVNLRNSKSGFFYTAPHREAAMPEWEAFFVKAGESHPDVVFLIVGSFGEWRRSLLRLPNVAISRRLGLGLADELSILLQSHLFMGSSSGFSALATFSSVPYLIANYEQGMANYVGLSVGDSRYPFAKEDQVLLWGTEDHGELHERFCTLMSRRSVTNHPPAEAHG